MTSFKTIALLGGGPSALFIFKSLLESGYTDIEITIFEKGDRLGAGMPYSREGACQEHITNVSGNEIPQIVSPISDWIRTVDPDTLRKLNIDVENFNEYKTLPRLLFGNYLQDQFKILAGRAKEIGLTTRILFNHTVTDIVDDPGTGTVRVEINGADKHVFDRVVVCTGHYWPRNHEGRVPNYFDSPYPPSKLNFVADHAVAIRGSSLTAIDAIRTLSRSNGTFSKDDSGKLSYVRNEDSPAFHIIMHSRNGLLPALRFHLDDSHLGKDTVLSPEEIAEVRKSNDGFMPLDYIFERNFKEGIRRGDPDFYSRIRGLSVEEFVELIMDLRERVDAFNLLKAEFTEAERSIKRRESIYWKEMLGVLSFAMNYPAKYFSAEDMIRLKKVLMPLISVVIAYVPQSSAAEMLALHRAGCLDIVAVGDDSLVETETAGGITYHYTDDQNVRQSKRFQTFIDCIGQPHLNFRELPFPGLIEGKTVSSAKIYFRDSEAGLGEKQAGNEKVHQDSMGRWYLSVPGVAINDHFQVLDEYNAYNERIYIMAVPFIGGYNPDYSGLDFGMAASAKILDALF